MPHHMWASKQLHDPCCIKVPKVGRTAKGLYNPYYIRAAKVGGLKWQHSCRRVGLKALLCYGVGGWAIKQWTQDSHIPLCHRDMVNARTLSVHCFACCTAAQTRPVLNVALSSPHEVAIEGFVGCLGVWLDVMQDLSHKLWGTKPEQLHIHSTWSFTAWKHMHCPAK